LMKLTLGCYLAVQKGEVNKKPEISIVIVIGLRLFFQYFFAKDRKHIFFSNVFSMSNLEKHFK